VNDHALKRKRLARILAGFFLVFLLAEWGSHGIICSDIEHGIETASVSAADADHEDPCSTMIMCSDGKQRDRQSQTLGHDASQHNALYDRFASLNITVGIVAEPRLPFGTAEARFRPPDPPFHPPKFS